MTTATPMHQPMHVREPLDKGVLITAANTNRDGSGTIVEVVSAKLLGARIDHVSCIAESNTTTGFIRFFTRSRGGQWKLEGELAVTAATPSGSVACYTNIWTPLGGILTLPPFAQFGASTHNAENFVINPEGGHF